MIGRPTALLVLGGVLGATAVAIALAVATAKQTTESSRPPVAVDPAHAIPADVRTVLVSAAVPSPSEPGFLVRVRLREGAMPTRVVPAEVLTDEDCAPDAAGISHCRNVLRLQSGQTLVVRHPHDMTQVPCLSPGERVVVRPAAA